MVGLIERFYDPLEGRVLLDGQDLRSFNVGWLRKQVRLGAGCSFNVGWLRRRVRLCGSVGRLAACSVLGLAWLQGTGGEGVGRWAGAGWLQGAGGEGVGRWAGAGVLRG